MNNIFIDPYMFYIERPEHLSNAVQFYTQVIDLCDQYTIVLYEDLFSKLMQRGTVPFPINLSDIKNEDLRAKVNNINSIFSEILFHNALSLDKEPCSGEQNFCVIPSIEDDNKKLLYDVWMLMLRGCYEKTFEIEEKILTNRVCGKLKLFTTYIIECNCSCGKKFIQKVEAVEPDKLFSKKVLAISKIRNLLKDVEVCQEPQTIRDNHHNFIQDSEIRKYSDLTRKNKSVLKDLIKFGLKKIHFVERVADNTRAIGSIKNCKAEKRNKVDEVIGIFYSQKGYGVKTILYFPEEMGQALCEYTAGEFTYQNIMELNRNL